MKAKIKKLPIGIQTFPNMVAENYLYVDKTKEIYKLFSEGGKYYFLSRPRRFGKSLLISTLAEIFSGNREAFKDLWLYDKIEWKQYPVIHLDFLGKSYGNPAELCETLEFMINQNAQNYGIQLNQQGYDKRFNELIRKLSEKDPVVILVDEYDKPIISHIENPEVAEENRSVLRTFYEAIKEGDKYLKFVFITGVSKFSKVSIFSGLNNLRDITMSDDFATLAGYTEKELKHYFQNRLKEMAEQQNIPIPQLMTEIRKWYNGYSWNGEQLVYNPFSILLFFQEKKFDNYWFATATPTFLVKLIKTKGIDLKSYENISVDGTVFGNFDIENLESTALLFQAGYLTIKNREIDEDGDRVYYLTYPNKEVKDSFLKHLLRDFTEKEFVEGFHYLKKLKSAIRKNLLDEFFAVIKSLFASIPYNIVVGNREGYYHSIIYLLLKLAGADIRCEEATNTGRLDAVLETGEYIYIMEFKMGSEQDALAQIKEKKYYEKYRASGKKIILVGVAFNREERNIGNYCIEEMA